MYSLNLAKLHLVQVYFRGMFLGSFKESNTKEVNLTLDPDTEGHFDNYLHYLYSGQITLNVTNIFPLLNLSKLHLVQDLVEQCTLYINNTVINLVKTRVKPNSLNGGTMLNHFP